MLPRLLLRREWTALLGAVILLTSAGQAAAQTESRDWYDVEVVIFRQQDSGNVQSSERWPIDPEPAEFERYSRISDTVSEDADSGDAENSADPSGLDNPEESVKSVFRKLPDDVLGLSDSVQRLSNSNDYEILLHTAWRQPGLPGTEATAIALPLVVNSTPTTDTLTPDESSPETGFGFSSRLPPGLSGYVRLVRERYLHFEVDLRLRQEERDDREADEPLRGSLSLFGDNTLPVVVMQERRRMRSGELHYLDNPRLGILVQVKNADPDLDLKAGE